MVKNSAKNYTNIVQKISQALTETVSQEFNLYNTNDIITSQKINIKLIGDSKYGPTEIRCKDFNLNQTLNTSTTSIQKANINSTTDLKAKLESTLTAQLKQLAAAGAFGVGDKAENDSDILNKIKQSISLEDLFSAGLSGLNSTNDNQAINITLEGNAIIFASNDCDITQSGTVAIQSYQFMSAVLKAQLKAGEFASAMAKVSQSASAGTISGGCSGVGNIGSFFSIIFSSVAVGIIVTIIIFIIKYGLGGATGSHTKIQLVQPKEAAQKFQTGIPVKKLV